MWAAGMPALLNPKNDLAVGEGYVISNANLYFFGWVGAAYVRALLGVIDRIYRYRAVLTHIIHCSTICLFWDEVCHDFLYLFGG